MHAAGFDGEWVWAADYSEVKGDYGMQMASAGWRRDTPGPANASMRDARPHLCARGAGHCSVCCAASRGAGVWHARPALTVALCVGENLLVRS